MNLPQTQAELTRLDGSIACGCPLGEIEWVRQTARRPGLEYTLNPRGRPMKEAKK